MSAQKLRLFSRLQLAAHQIKKSADQHISDVINLTTAQAAVLTVLADGERYSQNDVASALGINESAVTAMVNRLLRYGYIARHRSESDKRAWELSLTRDGKQALLAGRKAFNNINHTIENELSPKEIEQFADYLERLSKAFNAEK